MGWGTENNELVFSPKVFDITLTKSYLTDLTG